MKAWSWKNSEVGISLGLGFHWGFGVIDDLLWSSRSAVFISVGGFDEALVV
jgi:hypothetical protein